jgi:hypothetical protein
MEIEMQSAGDAAQIAREEVLGREDGHFPVAINAELLERRCPDFAAKHSDSE